MKTINVNGNARTAAESYMAKHWCMDGTGYRLTMHSADDNGREWTELMSYHGNKLLFIRKTN